MNSLKKLLLLSILIIPVHSFAEAGADDMNKANNPLTPMLGLNFQDYFANSLSGSDETSNSFLLRGIVPHKTGGLPQIARVTLPYQSVPVSKNKKEHGFGDINLFDIFLLKPVKGIQFGVGPYFVLPTASKTETGADKWQAGLSAIAIKAESWGMVGGLLTYQHDVAGPSERPTQNIATAQPFIIFNFPLGYYMRSTGVMTFNLETGHYYIPVGAGLGKVWKLDSGTVVNLSIEPQWTVAYSGDNQPLFQTFAALNFQFPI